MSFASVAFIAALVFMAAATAYRLRRTGRRPTSNWLPRSMRSRVSEVYRREGWSEPHRRNGHRPRSGGRQPPDRS